jgi:protein ImuA
MNDSHTPLSRLKRRLETLATSRQAGGARLFTLGADALDARLGGGLARGALHEICSHAPEDHTTASGFALMLALRASDGRPILWVREEKNMRRHGQLYPPGVIALGAAPDQIVLLCPPDTLGCLRAGAESAGCAGVGAVVIEPFGEARALDLTTSRRLVLAAEKSGVATFVLRSAASGFSSAATTRWSVETASSAALPGNAPGHGRLVAALLRHRAGVAPFKIIMEWDHEQKAFREPALLRPVLPAAERGQMAA